MSRKRSKFFGLIFITFTPNLSRRPKGFVFIICCTRIFIGTLEIDIFSFWDFPKKVSNSYHVRFLRGTLAWTVAELHCMLRRSCTALCHWRRFVKDDMATWGFFRIRKWPADFFWRKCVSENGGNLGGLYKHQLVLFIFTI